MYMDAPSKFYVKDPILYNFNGQVKYTSLFGSILFYYMLFFSLDLANL